MKKITIILLLLPLALLAQRTATSSFDVNARFNAEAYDIELTMPRNMVDLDTMAQMWIRIGHRAGEEYMPVLESQNREFILMYAYTDFVTEKETEISKLISKDLRHLPTNNNQAYRSISSELKAAYGYTEGFFKPVEGKVLHPEDYVNAISGRKARRWFNADSVFIYTLPVDDPFKSGYTHCTGIYITKMDRPSIGLKLHFTDAGKKKEAKYIRSLRRKIEYRNDAWKYDQDVFKRAYKKYVEQINGK